MLSIDVFVRKYNNGDRAIGDEVRHRRMLNFVTSLRSGKIGERRWARMRKKKYLLALVVVVFMALAGLLVRWGLAGSESCDASALRGKAEIIQEHPITLLGDVLEMKVELRFCSDRITVYSDSLENLDVSPFDLRARSAIKKRKDGPSTVWEVVYTVQPLNTLAGKKYKASSMEIIYEEERLLKTLRITSNGIYIGSLLISDAEDIRNISKHQIDGEEKLNSLGAIMISLGAVIFLLLSGFVLRQLLRRRATQKKEAKGEVDFSARIAQWWERMQSRESLQALYFELQELELSDAQQGQEESLKRSLHLCEKAFDPESSAAEIRAELGPVISPIASQILRGGR